MPNKLLLIVICLLLFVACKKNNDSDYSNSKGCITRSTPKISDVVLGPADADTARRLFTANDIPLNDLQPFQVYNEADSSGAVYSTISAKQFFNGLPVVFGSPYFRFYKEKLLDSLFLFHGTLTDTDTSGHIGLEQLRKTFLDSKPDTYSYQNQYGANKNATHWADSCVVAVLSYAYKSYQEDYSNGGDSLFKAWAIYPMGNPFSPIALISDETGVNFPIHYISLF